MGYCGSKAAMRTIAKADVVLALGTRLGVFGLLPQYDMTYWPEEATLIQVDRDAKQWGLSKIPDLFSVADVKEYATELLQELKNVQPNRERNEGAHRRGGQGKGDVGQRARRMVVVYERADASPALHLGTDSRSA